MRWGEDFSQLDDRPEKAVNLTPRQIAVLVSGVAIIKEPGNWLDYDIWFDQIDAELDAILHELTVADA